ncbi:MAG: flagellin lysine-N-methylase [Lachnospiraceae bacterium]|nr:flagellin lysine-N-methylase [Lachnospiraceae bacterium]
MKVLSIESYDDFECIGGECPITCCGDWTIRIDDKTAEYYRNVDGEFGDELREGIDFTEDGARFKMTGNKKCIFLNENRLCKIYRKLGPDKLCFVCRNYPRSIFQVGDILFCGLANSCPEVNRMIMQFKEPFKILFNDSDEKMMQYEMADIPESEAYWNDFNQSIRAFTAGLGILQNRELALSDRLTLLIFFVERFQEIMRNNGDPGDLTGIFSQPSVYSMFLENFSGNSGDITDKIHAFLIVFRNMMVSSCDIPMWEDCKIMADELIKNGIEDPDAIKKAFQTLYTPEIMIEMEQLIAYRFFHVFMQGFVNKDFYERIAYEYILYSTLITYMSIVEVKSSRRSTQEERILFYSLCSRIEHSDEHKGSLTGDLKGANFYDLEKLLGLIR